MAEETVPHLSLTISEQEICEGALRVVRVIRPQWHEEDVEFKLLTDGITNKLVGCRAKDEDASETVLVRIYGNKTDLLIDRNAETRNIIILSRVGLAPSLYATFQNGLAYQFVPGCTLTDTTVKDPAIYKLIAERMAKLHKVRASDLPNPKPFIWDKLRNFLDLVPEVFTNAEKHARFLEIGVSKRQLQSEIGFLERSLDRADIPVVFSHNDLLLGNVVYTKERNAVTFIDFEYAAYNYQPFDIANHFLEFAGIDSVDYSKYPDKQFQVDWLKIYLDEFMGGASDGDVERLYQQVDEFVLVSHMLWGIWALIQAEHSYIDFDYLGYSSTRLKEYFLKKQLLETILQLPS